MGLEPGTRLGAFEVTALLGIGGMGEVYRARDTRLGRDVAIKVLPDAVARNADRLSRFKREARLLATLNHPGIAAIHGIDDLDGKPFLVLELVSGPTLAQRLDERPLGPADALKVCLQTAEALEAAHAKGIIHRDLKPSNIALTPEGKVKLLDFGLAKALDVDSGEPATSREPTATDAATREGSLLGTAPYMSPEQARGEDLDWRADIWAFGCVLFEALAGVRAFPGPTQSEVLAAVLRGEPDWSALPAATPPLVRHLLRRCLEKDKEQRLHDIADARLDIQEALTAPALDPGFAAPPRSPGLRRSLALVTLGALTATVGLLLWRLAARPALPRGPSARFVIGFSPDAPLRVDAYAPIALSPDGSRLAYVTDNGRLMVRPLDRVDATPLPGTEGASEPFFSPDGQWIGFWAFGARLSKIPATGGAAPQALCEAEDLLGASWGSDGTIVFAPSPNSGLVRVRADGGPPESLTRVDPSRGEVGHRWPELLPGGKAVLFTIQTGSGPNDFLTAVESLTTHKRTNLVEGATFARYSPTGHLVYVLSDALHAVPFDAERLKIRGPAVRVMDRVTTGPSGNAWFSFANDGTLALVPGTPIAARQLAWVDRRGVVRPLAVARQPFWGLRLAPDGRRLAVEIGHAFRANIWVYDLTGETRRRLSDEELDVTPVWTLDGTRIAYATGVPAHVEMAWRTVDGSKPAQALFPGHAAWPAAFTADGRLLFAEWRGLEQRSDGGILRLDGTHRPEYPIAGRANEFLPRLSPDGRWIGYLSDASGRQELHVVPFAGHGAPLQVTTDGANAFAWSPRGDELFVRSGNKMMAVPVMPERTFSAGRIRLLFENPRLRDFDVAPGGQRFIAVLVGEEELTPPVIEVVQGWFDELKRRVPE